MEAEIRSTTVDTVHSVAQADTVYRPARDEKATVLPFNSEGRNPRYVIRDEDHNFFILTHELGTQIFDLLDGSRTIDDIQIYMLKEEQKRIKESQLETFLDLCGKNNLLQDGTWRVSRADDTGNPWDSLGFYTFLFNASDAMQRIADKQRWWLNGVTMALASVLGLIAIVFLFNAPAGTGLTAPISQMTFSMADLWLLMLPFIFLLEIGLHELGHALACAAYGVKSRGFGFGLLWGVLPVFFTDTTDAYSLDDKYKRIMISLAGPLVDLLVLGVVALLVWSLPPESTAYRLALAYSAFPISMLLINLNPFLIRLDGYWIVTDWLELPGLRQSSVRYIKTRLFQLVGKADEEETRLVGLQLEQNPRLRFIFLAYAVCAMLWTGFYATAFVSSFVQNMITTASNL